MSQTTVQIPVEDFKPHGWQTKFLLDFDKHSHRFYMLNWHRRARKTTLGLNLLIREANTFDKRVYLYVAPTYKMAKNIVWRDPNMLDRYLPKQCVKRKNETELFIEFDNGSILFVRGADDPDSLRGIDCDGVVLDEYSLMSRNVWEEGLRPIITQRADRWALFTFTPKGMNHCFDYWVKSENWDDWYRMYLPVSKSNLLPKEELAKAKKEMPIGTYQQEFECSFLSQDLGVFRQIEQCIAGDFQPPVDGFDYIIGLDVARTIDYNVLFVLNRQNKHIDYYARWNKTSWNLTRERVRAVAQRYNHALVVMDATGVGDPIVEDLMRRGVSLYHHTNNRAGIKFTNILKEQMVEKLQVSLEQRLVTFPQIDVLVDELRAYQQEKLPSGKTRYTAPEGKHDDAVTALMLAIWGLGQGMYENVYAPEMPKTKGELFWDMVKADIEREEEHKMAAVDSDVWRNV